MMVLPRSPFLRVICVILALVVHAAIAGAFMAAPTEEPAPPEVELEILAAITSEATPVDMPEVTADAMQAAEASEAVAGDVANMVSDVLEEVASITPVETVTPPDPQATREEAERDALDEVKPQDQPSENTSWQEAVEPKSVETIAEISNARPAESLPQAAEIAPIEPTQIVPPVDLVVPLIEAKEAPKIAALTAPEEVVEQPKRELLKEATAPKPVKKAAERKSAKETAKPKSAKSRTAARPRPQHQMTAGSRQSKVAQREGKSAAKRSGGKIANSAYRSIVQARLSARKSALQPALRPGSKGYVIVSFSIGASGRVTRASVVKSSGSSAIDSVARAMVASTSFPPPPGGSFSARLPVMVK